MGAMLGYDAAGPAAASTAQAIGVAANLPKAFIIPAHQAAVSAPFSLSSVAFTNTIAHIACPLIEPASLAWHEQDDPGLRKSTSSRMFFSSVGVAVAKAGNKASSSFLKKRTKKLLRLEA